MEWQPIETAPKDGTDVLLWFPGRSVCAQGRWFDRSLGDPVPEPWETGWEGPWSDGFNADARNCFGGEPTHWMPKPPTPTQDTTHDR